MVYGAVPWVIFKFTKPLQPTQVVVLTVVAVNEGGLTTTICFDSVSVQPLRSVTVSTTGYVPAAAKVLVAILTLAVLPSPKVQPYWYPAVLGKPVKVIATLVQLETVLE